MSDLKAFGWSVAVALNVLVAAGAILWLLPGSLGLYAFLGTWPLIGAAAGLAAWIGTPSPGEKTGKAGVRGHP